MANLYWSGSGQIYVQYSFFTGISIFFNIAMTIIHCVAAADANQDPESRSQRKSVTGWPWLGPRVPRQPRQ